MSAWLTALEGFDVRSIAPRPVPAALGFPTPAAALAHACGPPSSAPDSPLLVAVNDPDRATDTAPALRALRDACGERLLRVVVATGTHTFPDAVRAAHEARLRHAAGEPAEVHWHDASAADLAPIGDARMCAHLAAARDVVAIGSVEPHWFAGITGGHKTLAIGLLSRPDISAHHRLALDDAARPLVLRGNPCFAGLVRLFDGLAEGRSLLALQHLGDRWFGGEPLDCTRACLAPARARYAHAVDEPLDFVVGRVHPPLDRCLYQAEKAVKHAEHAIRPGGAIVTDAACLDGVGPDRFIELLARAPHAEAARDLVRAAGYRLGDHKAVRLRALQDRGVRLALVAPGFPQDVARVAGIDVVASPRAAARWLEDTVGRPARGALVDDAAHTVLEAA